MRHNILSERIKILWICISFFHSFTGCAIGGGISLHMLGFQILSTSLDQTPVSQTVSRMMTNVAVAVATTLILVTFCIASSDLGTNSGLVTSNANDSFETANLISSPIKCDDEDSDKSNTGSRSKRYVLSGCQWDHKDLTYNVGCVPGKYNRTLVEKDIARAFAAWSDYTDLTFTPKPGKVDIVLRFGNIDGIKNRMAYALFPCNDRGVEIVFDQEELWAMIGKGKNRFYRVAIHEIGHALGIDHSNIKPSIMNYGLDNWPESGLPLDDINAVQKIYGPRTEVELQ